MFVLDIYAASEQPIQGVTANAVVKEIQDFGAVRSQHCSSFADAIAAVRAVAQAGDVIVTLGAGSVWQLGPQIIDALKDAKQAAAI